ncbi:unnamed protein product, partial [Prorocentrum cordatum]
QDLWQDVIADEHLRCWLSWRPGGDAVTEEDLREIVDNAPWTDIADKDGRVHKACWMVREGCSCPFRYGKDVLSPDTIPPWMDGYMRRWLSCLGLLEEDLPNSVNLTLHGGVHGCGWSADDEPLFQSVKRDTRVINVALGAKRDFGVGPRAPWCRHLEAPGGAPRRRRELAPAKDSATSFEVKHGDFVTMEGLFQKHFVHALSREVPDDGEVRATATFRWIVEHASTCALHRPGSAAESSDSDGEASSASNEFASCSSHASGAREGHELRSTASGGAAGSDAAGALGGGPCDLRLGRGRTKRKKSGARKKKKKYDAEGNLGSWDNYNSIRTQKEEDFQRMLQEVANKKPPEPQPRKLNIFQ